MLGVLDTINKSKTHDCERNLSSMILKVIKWYTREIKKGLGNY